MKIIGIAFGDPTSIYRNKQLLIIAFISIFKKKCVLISQNAFKWEGIIYVFQLAHNREYHVPNRSAADVQFFVLHQAAFPASG